MSESPTHSSVPKARSHFNNWISAIGGVIAVGALFSFALLVWIDFTQENPNPYLGLFTYLVAPSFLILGLGLVFFGAWAQRRWSVKHAAMPDKWRLDFTNPRQRRPLVIFGIGALGFIMLSAFGSYQTYHYAESVQFCGEVCHTAMNPEFVTYQRSAHARVDCVDCHVGEGVKWAIKAKLNGTHQLIAYLRDNYNRPIETPLTQIRPAADICAKCHWPEKEHGNVARRYDHFLSDKANTAYSIRMILHMSEPKPGGGMGGIHWHAGSDEKVEYYATDSDRQEIPWMRVTKVSDGSTRVYRTAEFTEEPPAAAIRTMDCMDCHNRPAHTFPAPNDSVERAMALGTISRNLPNVKREAVKAMVQSEITTDDAAAGQIDAYLRKKYAEATETPAVSAEVQRLFASTMFPERKADWRHYPDNRGHKDWIGCFRCHDDKHLNTAGKPVPASDCKSCHTIISQGQGPELDQLDARGLDFAHPDGELTPDLTCSDCHNGGIQQ